MATATLGGSAQGAPANSATASSEGRKLFTFLCMVFGMFMAILDIQIVSASLSEIQAGVSASADEISWVQTAYLIAEVIMIPLSGMLSRVLSTRWMFAISAGGFTLMSLLCATSSSIGELILWRACQGFIGGGMIPTVFASAYTIFPPAKRATVTPIIGLVATLAPTIGPTIGGYLTDLFSWHWLFLINVVPGIFVTITAVLLIDFDEPNFALLDRFDWAGLAGMAGMLGPLEYVLEEGPNHDWFDETSVAVAAVIAVLSAILFFWRAFTAREPIVDLRTFTDRNFTGGCVFSFIMGIGLYGLTYLYPVYLARVRGFSALQIGETMFVTGICMFVTAPIAGRLMSKIDPRYMMAAGFIGFGLGTWWASYITKDWDFWELLVPQVLRGVSLMTCMLPINNIALGTLHPSRMKNASGIFNLTRNLGGAVGLALINSLLNNRWDLHLARLHDAVTWSRFRATEMMDNLTGAFAPLGSDARLAAAKQMSLIVRQQALVLSFGDIFLVLTALFVGMACLTPLIRRPNPAMAGGGGH